MEEKGRKGNFSKKKKEKKKEKIRINFTIFQSTTREELTKK